MGASKRMIELVALLNAYNYQYYVQNKPTVSDYEFDMLLKELETLEKQEGIILPTSPTQRVGSDLENEFKEVRREKVMGSIANCYDKDELLKWMQTVVPTGTEFTVGPKYDGTSCSLIYKDGELVQASTRGNGLVGSDITENARTIKSIPLSIPLSDDCEIRGEILMPKSSFQKLNKERLEQGLEPFANERNAAAGSIKQLNSRITAERNLIFRPFCVFCDNANFEKQTEMTNFANSVGFCTDIQDFTSADPYEIIRYIEEFEQKYLKNMDYCMDGVVIKVNDLSWQEKLGYSQKVPYWAKAFKFKQESASTKLLNVEWFVGRSGKLTPVGILDTVSVDGSNISNVTLNNMNYINSLDIRIGSYVFIEKGGAVIPKVTGIDYERHILENYDFETCKKIEEPSVCPVCGQPVVKKENADGNEGIHLYCINKDCEAKVIARLEYFVSKDCMDIDGLGTSTLVSLYEFNNVRNWFDLYKLNEADFTYLGKNGQKVYENIQKSKEMPADRVLTALGIPMIGKVAAKALLECYGNIKDIYTDIVDYHGDKLFAEKPIGTAASNELVAFVLDSDNEKIFANLFELLNYAYISNKPVGGPLEGKTLLATGTLENFPREEIKDSIISHGGKYASSVSKKLDYLIVGSKPGASKVTKATELGIKMISESEYLDLIK